MSINSKARRDAKKRRGKATASAGNAAASTPIEPHAELRDAQGRLLGGIVRREGEWTLGIGGRIVGETASAARVLAMLKRAATLHEDTGTTIRMSCSPSLSAAAAREVAEQGLSFEQFEAQLAMDLAAGAQHPLAPPPDEPPVRH
ncbi:MAG: hypothetical protein M3Q40_03490 [Pseudomonadota bacterium]|nr:hypothetical protein [Pseudomonadota bacterium]